MMNASGGFGTRWMVGLINNIVIKCCISDDWTKSIMVHVCKWKADPLVCGAADKRFSESVGKEGQLQLESEMDG